MNTGATDPNILKVVAKTFRVIEVVAQHSDGVQLGELARQCGKAPKATVFRILHTLKALGYVEQDRASGAYRLTHELAWLGRSETRDILKRAARPHLERLRAQFEQTVGMAVLDHDQLLYIEILEGLRSVRMNATVNTYAPLHSTSLGKAILSKLDTEELTRVLGRKPLPKLTSKTITSLAQLERHLAEVRAQGHAVDDEETEPGARCVGAVISGRQGKPVGAISVSGPLSSITLERVPVIAREVKKTCKAISELLRTQEGAVDVSASARKK